MITVIFGTASDGYAWNFKTNYLDATGETDADGVNNGNTGYFSRQDSGSQYGVYETFIGFDYPAIPDTEYVTSCVVRIKPNVVRNTFTAQEARLGGVNWKSGGLTTSDYRTAVELAASRLDGTYVNIQSALNRKAYAGSMNMLGAMKSVTEMYFALYSSRQLMGAAPSGDELIGIWTADASGTSDDPAMIYTSAPRSTLFGVLGAQVQLSDGTWAFIESNGAVSPTLTLKHRNAAGTVTTIGTIPIGTANSDFATPAGIQAFALISDPSDNLYVFGRHGAADNNLAAKAYTKGSGHTWAAVSLRSAATPAYGTAINQVAATYHSTAGGVAHVVMGHTAGSAESGSNAGVTNATVNLANVRAASGSVIIGSGSLAASLMPTYNTSSTFNTFPNEVGSGMDVAAAINGNAEWGFFYSFQHGQIPGDNDQLAGARYILNATASSLSHASYESGLGWGRKDAGAKVRVVPISQSTACFVSTDADSGYGITVYVQQHSGTTPGSVTLEGKEIGGEGIATMQDGPTIAPNSDWDCVFNATENRLWIYYQDNGNPGRLMRTSFNLTTMQYDRNEVQVYNDASGTALLQAVRVERNKPVTQNALVTMAKIDGSTRSTVYVVDVFNLAPTAPTLTPITNYDATAAKVFTWTHNDPNPGDAQSAYQLEISRVDTGVVALDTGKVTSTTSSRNVAGGTLTNGVSYRWRVRTYDTLDSVSPWSGYGTFSTSAGGTVTITSPATDNVLGIVTDDYPIAWSVSGTTQAGYRVWLYRGATLVSDSGWITSTATTHTISGMTSDVEHTVQVRVRNASNVESGTGSRFITPSFAAPEVPLLSASVGEEYTLLAVENPEPGQPALGIAEESFESGLGSFASPSGCTAVASTEQAHRGTQSMKMTVTGTPTQAYIRPAQVACVPGERLSVRLWAYRPVSGPVQAAIDWFDAAHAYISTSAVSTTLAAATWTEIVASGTAPAGTAFFSYGPTIPTNPATGTVAYIDEVVPGYASDRPDVSRNEILRRKVGETGDWEVIGECAPDGTFRDYTAESGTAYEYIARGQS